MNDRWYTIKRLTPKSIELPSIVGVLVLFCGIFCASVLLFPKHSVYAPMVDFSEDWTYTAPSGEQETVSLPYVSRLSPQAPGVSVKKRLPDALNAYDVIGFLSKHLDVNVFVDGDLIYHYDSHRIGTFLKASVGKWHYVSLPYGSGGKEVRIVFDAPYDRHVVSIEEVAIGNQSTLSANIISQHLPQYLLGISIFVFGLIFLLVAAVSFQWASSYYEMGCIALMSVLVGVWIQSSCSLPSAYIVFDQFVLHLLEHNAIILAPIPFLLFLKQKVKRELYPWLMIPLLGFLLYFLVSNFLQFAGIADYQETVVVFYMLVLCTLLLSGVCLLASKERKLPLAENLGYILLIGTIVRELFVHGCYPYADASAGFQVGFLMSLVCLSANAVQKVLYDVQQAAKLQEQLKEKQEYISASQMKPHFIYNALGAIKTMIYTNPDMAYQTMDVFSKYLRSVIGNQEPEKLIPFSRELDHIQAYCEIEKCRFQSRISVEYDIGTTAFMVPPISIQPIVENAIKHGVFPKEEGGTVKLTTIDCSNTIEIIVEDDGVGFSAAEKASSVGLSNISFRLKNLLKAELDIESKPDQGTKVTVRIPKKGGR